MIVGIRIDGYKKTYYYHTNNDYKVGDTIKVLMPSGGTPDATIVEVDSQYKPSRISELREVR